MKLAGAIGAERSITPIPALARLDAGTVSRGGRNALHELQSFSRNH
jgi:hypothetical protein